MRKILLSDVQNKVENAGFKAKKDVRNIFFKKNMSIIDINVYSLRDISGYWGLLKNIIILIGGLRVGDIIFVNYPVYGKFTLNILFMLKKIKKIKVIGIIHDLDSLRSDSFDDSIVCFFDMVISHNQEMSKFLKKIGVIESKIYNLNLFDYILDKDWDCFCDLKADDLDNYRVVFAGNLNKEKSGFIYKIQYPVDIWGVNYDKNVNLNLNYCGFFDSENPKNFYEAYTNSRVFGLIWDGGSINSCEGRFGDYLLYNNPHKTSFYLSQNIPVIVWNSAAIANFILSENCGIVVDTLSDLDEKLSLITLDQYRIMKENASRIGEKVRSGFYLSRAVDCSLEKLLE
ncbi:hypothetical protein ACG9H2_15555 [Acinetobacter ursingii]|uniref:hypothetical protein n=1 Tax=Acinetobacter ursingii TaxID=108980 RepID=UPI003AF9D8C6